MANKAPVQTLKRNLKPSHLWSPLLCSSTAKHCKKCRKYNIKYVENISDAKIKQKENKTFISVLPLLVKLMKFYIWLSFETRKKVLFFLFLLKDLKKDADSRFVMRTCYYIRLNFLKTLKIVKFYVLNFNWSIKFWTCIFSKAKKVFKCKI